MIKIMIFEKKESNISCTSICVQRHHAHAIIIIVINIYIYIKRNEERD